MPATPDETATAERADVRRQVPAQRGRGAPVEPRRPPLALAAAVTTGWAAIVSLTPVLAVVLLVRVVGGGDTGTGTVLRVGLAGWLRESGLYRMLTGRVPLVVRHALRTGLMAALLVLAAGAATAGTAIAFSGSEASAMLAEYHTGVSGQAGLTLLCLVYAPDLAVWAAAYLVGPGFTVGAGTIVSAGRVTLGGLPAVPALAGLPSRPAGGWGALLLGVPLAAGMAAGWLLARRRLRATDAGSGWAELLGAAALAGPVAGLVLALAALAAGGSLGAGRLAAVGPAAPPMAAVGAGLVAAG